MHAIPARPIRMTFRRLGRVTAVVLIVGTSLLATATAASASPRRAAALHKIGSLKLKPATGFPKARGRFDLFRRGTGQKLAFTIRARGLPATSKSDYSPDAYGVWLAGGGRDHFLGFAPAVGKSGRFAVSGPRPSDKKRFRHWLMHARRILVTREILDQPKQHGQAVLRGNLSG